jgi:hypothetical protein
MYLYTLGIDEGITALTLRIITISLGKIESLLFYLLLVIFCNLLS